MFRSVAARHAHHVLQPLTQLAIAPVAKGVAFGLGVVNLSSRTTPSFKSVNPGPAATTLPSEQKPDTPTLARKLILPSGTDIQRFGGQAGEDFAEHVDVLKDGSIVVKPTQGPAVHLPLADPSMLDTPPIAGPGFKPRPGNALQLIDLEADHPYQQHIIKDPATSEKVVKRAGLDYDLALHSTQNFWDQILRIPHTGKRLCIPTSVINNRSIAAGRTPEWGNDPFVTLVQVPEDTYLLQISTDALPLVPIGTQPKARHNSQAYEMARAIYEGRPGPIGGYFVTCAPVSPDQAAEFAAILNVWKPACTHFSLLRVKKAIWMIVGRIGGQPANFLYDQATGRFVEVPLLGGAVQVNPFDVAQAQQCLEAVDLHQIPHASDARIRQTLKASGRPGGALVEELESDAYHQLPFNGHAH